MDVLAMQHGAGEGKRTVFGAVPCVGNFSFFMRRRRWAAIEADFPLVRLARLAWPLLVSPRPRVLIPCMCLPPPWRVIRVSGPMTDTQQIRLYSKAVFMGFQRSRHVQKTQTAILKIEGAATQQDADFYLGKRVCYIYKVRGVLPPSRGWGKRSLGLGWIRRPRR